VCSFLSPPRERHVLLLAAGDTILHERLVKGMAFAPRSTLGLGCIALKMSHVLLPPVVR